MADEPRRVRTQVDRAGDDHSFLDRFNRRATLIGGPMDGRVVPIPLPDSMPMPESTCMGGPGPSPRVWHHYERAADDWYRYAGPCADIDHHGGAPHDHCDHQWDDATERGHRCELVHGHDGDHACGCCNAQKPPPLRRRWWHRLTRALAGRWLHVLTPGFLGEMFNDIWSHTRHRLTRRFDR